jgi:glycosyltransferase involved in cell wall biosynthesis
MNKIKVLIITPRYPFPKHSDGSSNIHANIMMPNNYYTADILSLFTPDNQKFVDSEQTYDSEFIKIPTEAIPGKRELFIPWLFNPLPFNVFRFKRFFRQFEHKIREIENKYDVLHISTPQLLPIVDKLPEKILKKVICSPVDTLTLITRRRIKFETSLVKKIIWWNDLVRILRFEKKYYSKVRKIVLASSVDGEEISRVIPDFNYYSIPNGVDTEFFSPNENEPIDPNMVLFSGNMSYKPNLDCAMFIVKKIMPLLVEKLPSVKLYLVGNSPDDELLSYNGENIKVTGFVNDLREYINKAALCISPLQYSGGGFKNKVIEAMSMKKIVVGSTISFEGIDGVNGKHFFEIKTLNPDDWAGIILRILNNYAEHKDVPDAARNLILEKFSWEKIRSQFNDVYKTVVTP